MLFGDEATGGFAGGLAVERVDESDGREELLELEEELDEVAFLGSAGGDRSQSVFPLEAAFVES